MERRLRGSGRGGLMAAGLMVLFATAVNARAALYIYESPDGTRVISDHALIHHPYRLLRVSGVRGGREGLGPLPGPRHRWRARPCVYDSLIRRYAAREHIAFALIKAIMRVESGFNPDAVSPRGARGLMQIRPETAARYGVRDVYDPAQNIRAGARYLRDLWEAFGHKYYLVIAAYNAGEKAVRRYQGIPPFAETQLYVRRVLQYQRRYGPRP